MAGTFRVQLLREKKRPRLGHRGARNDALVSFQLRTMHHGINEFGSRIYIVVQKFLNDEYVARTRVQRSYKRGSIGKIEASIKFPAFSYRPAPETDRDRSIGCQIFIEPAQGNTYNPPKRNLSGDSF